MLEQKAREMVLEEEEERCGVWCGVTSVNRECEKCHGMLSWLV